MQVKKNSILFLLCVGFANFVVAQFPSVLISKEFEPEEVSIAINPKNPANIVAGANINSSYFSQDTGRTWQRFGLTCDPYNVYGDPVVFWDTLQNAYFMHLSLPDRKKVPDGSWVDRIVINKSTDLGKSYPSCLGIGKVDKKVQDKPWIGINRKRNSLHIAWTQFDKYESKDPKDSSIIRYSQSLDAGQTWSEPKRISFYGGDCIDSDNTVEGATPCIGPDGTIYVVWSGPKGIVCQRSEDNGKTWLAQEKQIIQQKNGWDYKVDGIYRANGMPFSACDVSPKSPYSGRVYACYSDEKNGEKNKDLFLVFSDDKGNTWSEPILITFFPNHKEQFMHHFTIDEATGYLYAIYYDRRNYATGTLTDLYLSVSRNGGALWESHRITEKPFQPSAGVFFGDYIGVSAHDGIIRPIWMQTDENKKLAVFTCLLNDAQLKTHQVPTPNLQINKTNTWKFDTKVKLPISLQNPTEVTVALYDPLDPNSEKIVIKTKKLKAGDQTLTLNTKKLSLDNKTYIVAFYAENLCQTNWLIKKE
jgi:hypothetical protein